MVHIGEISFCDRVAFNIKSDETKKFLLDHIEKKYNLKIITKHFDKFEPRMMQNINNNPHLVCTRSNGNPYFLYLTKINYINYCIYIDKKVQQGYFFPRMIITNFHFHDDLFTDTILDGEMVKKKDTEQKWSFVVNDLIVYKGQHLHDHNLVKRLNLLYELLDSEYLQDAMDVNSFCVKKYFKYNEIEYMVTEHIPKLPYTCRGIYFKPLFLRFRDVLVNFDDSLIKKVERNKFKNVKTFMLHGDEESAQQHVEVPLSAPCVPSSNNVSMSNTSQYYTRKTNNPDVYELFDTNDGSLVGTACVPTMKISKYLREIFANKNMVDKVLLPYKKNEMFNDKWILVL